MFNCRIHLLAMDIGIGIGASIVSYEHGIALAVISSSFGRRVHMNKASITVAGFASTDPFADDG